MLSKFGKPIDFTFVLRPVLHVIIHYVYDLRFDWLATYR